MGMYTELVVKAEVKKGCDPTALAILRYMFGDGPKPATLPGHRFFSCPRWEAVGHCSSFYHYPRTVSSWYEDLGIYFFSRSDLKNYDNEIDLFLDWAKAYIEPACGNCLGWTWYEEEEAPTLIIWNDLEP